MYDALTAFNAQSPLLPRAPYPTPKPDGTHRIQRTGTCPTGYVGSGNFCEPLHKDTPAADAENQERALPIRLLRQRRCVQGAALR